MSDVVITCLLNSTPDPQRGTTLPASVDVLGDLVRSIGGRRKLVVLTDCLEAGDTGSVEFVRVDPDPTNVYFLRWRHIAEYIEDHPELERVWCVDGTDVEMLCDPFDEMVDGAFYIGSEDSTVGVPWMRTTNPSVGTWIEENADKRLLNPGLVGGDAETVMAFAYRLSTDRPDLTDMGIANVLAYEAPNGFVTGDWHTPYKSYTYNDTAWWKHK